MTNHNAYAHIGSHIETGILTTEHSASSYGLPVFVSTQRGRTGQVLGAADVDGVSLGLDPDHFGADVVAFKARVRAAGYTIA